MSFLGLGSATLTAYFIRYRSVFAVLALGSLGYSFYLNYFKYHSPLSSKILLWISTFFSLGILFYYFML